MILRTVLVLAFLFAPALASAESWSRYVGREVDALRVEGVNASSAVEIRRGLALTPRSKLIGRTRAVLRDRVARADLDRVRLWLARNGFPQATVTMEVEPRGDRVRVVMKVVPGPRVRVESARIEGGREGLPMAALERRLVALRGGVVFRDATVLQVRDALQGDLAAAGYARAQVRARVETLDPGRVDVTFELDPGPNFRFGGLEVQGVPEDLERLVQRVVRDVRGLEYRPSVLVETRDDLRELGLFRQVRVSTEVADSTLLDLTCALSPRDMRTLEASVGTWSDHPIQVRASWRHRNLFSRGRGFTVGGAYALRRQDLGFGFEWPALLQRRSRTEWRFDFEIEDEAAYLLRSGALRWTNLFRSGRHVSWRAGVALRETSLDVRTPERALFDVETGRQFVFEGQWYYDGSDDPLDPTRGWRWLVEGAWAPVIAITDAPYVSARTALSRMHPLWGRIVFASRADLAWAESLGDAQDLLPSQRWFAGGFNTMRGAGRRGLGPAVDGDPVGGGARVLLGAELRVPVRGIFGLSAFVDAGQVWSRIEQAELDAMAVAVGGGLLARTPIGPLHLEVAHNVADRPLDGTVTRLQFGIGHPF